MSVDLFCLSRRKAASVYLAEMRTFPIHMTLL
jgi:hypothetical protein